MTLSSPRKRSEQVSFPIYTDTSEAVLARLRRSPCIQRSDLMETTSDEEYKLEYNVVYMLPVLA